VALAKAVGYDSAGTVEFVASQDADFYFLEMNTRLQVEHPVTELITGVDLVEEMIRVAAGERLRLSQSDVTIKGWAVESRLYAEDPDRNFLPSIGRLKRLRMPTEYASDTTVRVDTGVVEGSEISRYYDPMIAKVVTHGSTREAAIDTMAGALDHVAIEGIRHNGPFLSAIMAHPRWREGALSTGFIAEEFPSGGGAALTDEARHLFAAIAFAVEAEEALRRRHFGPHPSPVPGPLSALFDDEGRVDGSVDAGESGAVVTIDDTPMEVRGTRTDPLIWQGLVDEVPVVVGLTRGPDGIALSRHGMRATVKVTRPRVADLSAHMPKNAAADALKTILCPMPGLVVSLNVKEGDAVEDGQALAVIEAMKMENVIRAERAGTVKSVNVSEGDSLAVDAVILEFE
ncbi:MAG: biotin/lipoyl-containing protein, partial [Pseudomonadota bacterium]